MTNTATFEYNGSASEELKDDQDLDDTLQIKEETDDGFRIITGCRNCVNEDA